MAGNVKSQMVDTAISLLASGGYQAASFRTVIDASGAPRGSIYHHFPNGKDELVTDAIRTAGERAGAALERLRGSDPVTVTTAFLEMWRALLVATDTRVGCSVAAVTMSAPDGALREEAGEVFARWRQQIAGLFAADGVPLDVADSFAALLIAATEGAVMLARASGSLEPFDTVAQQLRDASSALR
jgi:TetR/AcrR family transcriptional regulator, lmrAB and yxaGH operons repressor